MHNILMGIYPNPHMKDETCLPFSWIWKVVNYFVWIKVNVTMSSQVVVINIFFFGGSDADSYLSWSVWCHCWHRARWIQVQFYFSYRIWDVWLKFKLLCTIYFRIYPCTWYRLSKSWWGNPCFLGVSAVMLWMNM